MSGIPPLYSNYTPSADDQTVYNTQKLLLGTKVYMKEGLLATTVAGISFIALSLLSKENPLTKTALASLGIYATVYSLYLGENLYHILQKRSELLHSLANSSSFSGEVTDLDMHLKSFLKKK